MRIIHLSDIHLENNGVPIWETDTMCHLNKAINIIKSLANVDVIVVSGDLSNEKSIGFTLSAYGSAPSTPT